MDYDAQVGHFLEDYIHKDFGEDQNVQLIGFTELI